MQAARRFLIPFLIPDPPTARPDDTVYGLPQPERLFLAAERAKPPRLRLPVVPRFVPIGVCGAGVVAAFLMGAAVSRAPRVDPAGPASPIAAQVMPAPAQPAGRLPRTSPGAEASAPPALAAPARVTWAAQTKRLQRFPFMLQPSAEFTRIGPLALRLNKTDPKRQTYTLTLMVRGKRVELQDRALAEPVRFYPDGVALSEILVERIEPDLISGYLNHMANSGGREGRK